MAQYSVSVEPQARCLDSVIESLARVDVGSLACACSGRGGAVTFSVEESAADAVQGMKAESLGAEVIHLRVPNRAGCLSESLLPLSKAGVEFGAVSCACSAGDAVGTVSVGIKARQ
jgi:hypothetical protein